MVRRGCGGAIDAIVLGQTAVSVGDNESSEQQDPRLTSDFDIGVVRCFVVVLDNPTHAICV